MNLRELEMHPLELGINPFWLGMHPLGLEMNPLKLRMNPFPLEMNPLGLETNPLGLGINPFSLGIHSQALEMHPFLLGKRPAGRKMPGLGPKMAILPYFGPLKACCANAEGHSAKHVGRSGAAAAPLQIAYNWRVVLSSPRSIMRRLWKNRGHRL